MDPRSIHAIQDTVQAGIHIPSPRLDQVLERRLAGLPDQVPASIKDPVLYERFAACQQRHNEYAAAANKGA